MPGEYFSVVMSFATISLTDYRPMGFCKISEEYNFYVLNIVAWQKDEISVDGAEVTEKAL